jgi:signal transduction histidine kinase
MRRERASFQALFQATQAINRPVELHEVISLIVTAAADLLEARGAGLDLLDHADEENGEAGPQPHFVVRYALGLEESLTTTQANLPMGHTIPGRAVRSGQTQGVPDTAQEPDIAFPRLACGALRSLVVVPLLANGRMWGVLSIYYDRPGAFDAEDIRVLEAFAAVASTAVYHATLYDEARQGREAAEREQQRLRELEQLKEEFFSTAAHELRTPLSTIRLAAGLVDEQLHLLASAVGAAVDPRLLALSGLVIESSQRMHALVNDLLDLTQLEQGRAMLLVAEIDLRDVVRGAAESVMPLLADKGQLLSMHVPETICMVRGDRQRLEQVLVNLLANAHKYSPPGAPVEVRLVRRRAECQLRVRDSGPGVAAEERERIFERFYRSSMHRNDRTPSTGLGLPIARKIAEMHGGRLWVEPEQGGGSIFILSLPIVER